MVGANGRRRSGRGLIQPRSRDLFVAPISAEIQRTQTTIVSDAGSRRKRQWTSATKP